MYVYILYYIILYYIILYYITLYYIILYRLLESLRHGEIKVSLLEAIQADRTSSAWIVASGCDPNRSFCWLLPMSQVLPGLVNVNKKPWKITIFSWENSLFRLGHVQ